MHVSNLLMPCRNVVCSKCKVKVESVKGFVARCQESLVGYFIALFKFFILSYIFISLYVFILFCIFISCIFISIYIFILFCSFISSLTLTTLQLTMVEILQRRGSTSCNEYFRTKFVYSHLCMGFCYFQGIPPPSVFFLSSSSSSLSSPALRLSISPSLHLSISPSLYLSISPSLRLPSITLSF
jgi:hypothetical protein